MVRLDKVSIPLRLYRSQPTENSLSSTRLHSSSSPSALPVLPCPHCSHTQAITVEPTYARTGARDPLLSRYPSRSVYNATIPSYWTIGSVGHGGFLLSLLTRSATTHQRESDSKHLDPAHLTSQFLSASVAGQCQIEVTLVSASKRWTRLDVELWQYSQPNIKDYTLPSVDRILRIKTHYLFARLENVLTIDPQPTDPTPTFLERQCPLIQHPKELEGLDYSKIPDKFGFKQGMRWKECEFVKEGNELRWGCWFELLQGEDLRNCADLVPFFADCSKNGPEVLAEGKRPLPSWYPTLTFSLDFKTSFPLPSTSGSSSKTTFGLFATTKSIQNGRHDLTVEVWTSPCDLGDSSEGGGEVVEEDWRRKVKCVGISTQMAITTPMAFNQSKGGNKSSSGSESEGEGEGERKARL